MDIDDMAYDIQSAVAAIAKDIIEDMMIKETEKIEKVIQKEMSNIVNPIRKGILESIKKLNKGDD